MEGSGSSQQARPAGSAPLTTSIGAEAPASTSVSNSWFDESEKSDETAMYRSPPRKGRRAVIPQDRSKYPGFPEVEKLRAAGVTEDDIEGLIIQFWTKHCRKLRADRKKAPATIDPNQRRSPPPAVRSETTAASETVDLVDEEGFETVVSKKDRKATSRKRRLETSASKSTPAKKKDGKRTPKGKAPPSASFSIPKAGKSGGRPVRTAPAPKPGTKSYSQATKRNITSSKDKADESPFTLKVWRGHIIKRPMSRSEWEKLFAQIQADWVKHPKLLRVSNCYFDHDHAVIKCLDRDTFTWIQSRIPNYRVGSEIFKAWSSGENDGFTDANVFIPSIVPKATILDTVKTALDVNGMVAGGCTLRRVIDLDTGGRRAYLRIPNDAAKQLKESNRSVYSGLLELRFRLEEEKAPAPAPAETTTSAMEVVESTGQTTGSIGDTTGEEGQAK